MRGVSRPRHSEVIPQQDDPHPEAARVGWIDCAKGLTIALVVLLYANEWAASAANANGWLRHVVDFAAPFRMPGFFLLSGLLLSFSIERGWRGFLDRKLLHFAYFYLLWLTILVAFESPWTAAKHGWGTVAEVYLGALVRPYSMLWFIYLLPIFFVVTKGLQRVPPALVWLAAAALQVAGIETGVKVLDKFMPYYVFFYTGYLFAPHLFRSARAVPARPTLAIGVLAAWALLNGWAALSGHASAPGASLALGLLGAGAVIAGCALLGETRAAAPLAYCGRHSLVIYLAFYIPLVIAGKLALVSGWVGDVNALALLVTAAGIAGALVLHRLVRGTRLGFLFERPHWLRLTVGIFARAMPSPRG